MSKGKPLRIRKDRSLASLVQTSLASLAQTCRVRGKIPDAKQHFGRLLGNMQHSARTAMQGVWC